MKFFRPTWPTLLPPLLLVTFACMPILILRYTLYSLLALPLWPVIQEYGWVYDDKPQFLTPQAAIFAAAFWAVVLYLLLCVTRSLFRKR